MISSLMPRCAGLALREVVTTPETVEQRRSCKRKAAPQQSPSWAFFPVTHVFTSFLRLCPSVAATTYKAFGRAPHSRGGSECASALLLLSVRRRSPRACVLGQGTLSYVSVS